MQKFLVDTVMSYCEFENTQNEEFKCENTEYAKDLVDLAEDIPCIGQRHLKFKLKVLIPKEDKWAFDQGGMSYKGNGNLFYIRNIYIGTAGFLQIDKKTFTCRKNTK